MSSAASTRIVDIHPEPHCQCCGEPAETHSHDAYTQCCNELLCYGADRIESIYDSAHIPGCPKGPSQ